VTADILTRRLALLDSHRDLLARTLRGVEKEGLRVDAAGRLALTPHPRALGSALTNERITTDYSESLLELITGTHDNADDLIAELDEIHRYTSACLDGEVIWNQSMPATLPPEADIPIAWYGTSNTGMLKHVYRRGLAVRYGKAMQCIAGVHYNFSLHDALWEVLRNDTGNGSEGDTQAQRRSSGYIALIRNFNRYAWLLMYLFGAAPALARGFLREAPAALQALGPDTLYLPYATSLRMGDLGYHNKAQSELKPCYNTLPTFLERLYDAVTTPWPAYQKLGTRRGGEWLQLNTNILQIENEYYSSIRPKRTTGRCERPITALAERGVQYIEVRCLDIDPYSPVGISAETARFVDAFLVYCAAQDSPYFTGNGFCELSADNFNTVVNEGRRPGLMLNREGTPIALRAWGRELLDGIAAAAQVLDATYGGNAYGVAVESQRGKIDDPAATPSARVLDDLRRTGASFHDYMLELSTRHAAALRADTLAPERLARYQAQARESLAQQAALEAGDTIDFDAYVARYHEALKAPVTMHRE
jgi:glutamate--cysteine ligase